MDFLAKEGTFWIDVMPGLYSLPFLHQNVSVRCAASSPLVSAVHAHHELRLMSPLEVRTPLCAALLRD